MFTIQSLHLYYFCFAIKIDAFFFLITPRNHSTSLKMVDCENEVFVPNISEMWDQS